MEKRLDSGLPAAGSSEPAVPPSLSGWLPWLVLLLVLAGPLDAQPVEFSSFGFRFPNPGARSAGFGGAFAALADDATAAYANPAGLVQLIRPEVSMEARYVNSPDQSIQFLSDPGVEELDTQVTVHRGAEHDLGPAFGSFALPRGRWVYAVFGHRLADYRVDREIEAHETIGPGAPRPLVSPSAGALESARLDLFSAGLAAGWRWTERLSLGVSFLLSDASLHTTSQVFLPDEDSPNAPISFLPNRLVDSTRLDIGGTDVTIHLGGLWRMSDRCNLALFHRQGAKFDGKAFTEEGPAGKGDEPFEANALFSVPDVTGLGLSFRSNNRLTLSMELDRIEHSNTLELAPQSPGIFFATNLYKDVWELHLGAEYAWTLGDPIVALRFGSWLEDNGQRSRNEELIHYSVGLGMATGRYQLDIAADHSSGRGEVSMSVIIGI